MVDQSSAAPDPAGRGRGARARDRRRRTRRRVLVAALAVLLTAAVVTVGLVRGGTGDEASTPTPATPRPSPTPLAQVDLSGLPIERAAFCDRLDEDDVTAALGGPVTGTAHYASGERVPITAGLTDVAHEFSCTFEGAAGVRARAWVFAEPVTRAVGLGLAREAGRASGCRTLAGAPQYGDPAAATVCRTGDRRTGSSVVTLRGLFGDAWLSCELTAPAAQEKETVRRGQQWCVRVATTLGARP